MKINEVIRKYRKENNLTQEQIANYLGVTAPAVNKWENGISYPDITLLVPLARILKIDVDTLLSFNEDLTDTEINQFLKDLSDCIQKDGYETGFKKGEVLIKEYPNCDKLRLHTAEILNAYLRIKEIGNPEDYENKIIGWLEVVLTSQNEKIVEMAKSSLVTFYMNKGEYEKAQQQLDDIAPLGIDKRLTQAILYEKQSRYDAAYEIYENMLFTDCNQISSVLQLISRLLCTEKKYTVAERYATLAEDIALLFDLGDYAAYTPNLFLAIEKKDKEQCIEMLAHTLNGINTMGNYEGSDLYSHMKFNANSDFTSAKKMLRDSIMKSPEFDFIRNEPTAQKLFHRLENEL